METIVLNGKTYALTEIKKQSVKAKVVKPARTPATNLDYLNTIGEAKGFKLVDPKPFNYVRKKDGKTSTLIEATLESSEGKKQMIVSAYDMWKKN